ncbi:single-stranded DNA-binding protein [Enterococcus faecalis]|jgi:single stranded DNA-binding protein (ssb)|uniref:single-stranded DNA-binding protein n=1 Tax=Enterococcus TaxID=1350 RepID=UPI000B3C10FA|nr:single-stranded DNA-binding protein [Enterococcus faecalis]ARV05030.1 single-stranded DNA-binding protein [Enterococcus faecalis]MBG9437178.1 single-stranded DNA-binding protein [Enterococcus faecalis]MBG9439959.1 single-stranded DNA-binding protein [Enterococcus faecalis]MBG9442734.1 single-stranded DNA-binding protein [Enterococcus faecalis]MDL4860284.1 single-stranded DNA-binding protein [Enterococcus faecalis]
MINNVVLVGRLTKDPDLRFTANGEAVATFTLAVNRNFKNQQGNREADFIHCVIWRKPAEILADYSKKGTLLGVVGRIQTRNYKNQSGQRVYVTEVTCESFQLLQARVISEEEKNQHKDIPKAKKNDSQIKEKEELSDSSLEKEWSTEREYMPFDSDEAFMDISEYDLPF